MPFSDCVCVRGGVAGQNSLCSLEGHEWKEIRGYLRLGHCVVGGLAGTQRQGSSVPPERSGTGLGFGSRWIYFTAIFRAFAVCRALCSRLGLGSRTWSGAQKKTEIQHNEMEVARGGPWRGACPCRGSGGAAQKTEPVPRASRRDWRFPHGCGRGAHFMLWFRRA